MFFQQIVQRDLGCASYIIGCQANSVAAVIDARWDQAPEYQRIATQEGLTITHAIDTHVHADHISGNRRLARHTGATIHIHEAANAGYEHAPLRDGDVIALGKVELVIVHSPGHTPESVTVLVRDTTRGPVPWFALTGDTLFVGDVGRPDLAGPDAAPNLYHTLRDRYGSLPDGLEIYPAHVAGSSCGRAMSAKTSTTLGFERLLNPAFLAESEEAFVTDITSGERPRPRAFLPIIARNRAAPPLEPPELRPLALDAFTALPGQDAIVVDTRPFTVFAQGHLPGAINLSAHETAFSSRASWVLEHDQPIMLVVGPEDDPAAIRDRLFTVGHMDVTGYVVQPERQPVEGVAAVTTGEWTIAELAEHLHSAAPPVLVDVRERDEWEAGHVPGALHIPYWALPERAKELPQARRIAVMCGSGSRSALGSSLVQRAGHPDVVNILGGINAWRRAGLPVDVPEVVSTS